jgi:hypothetical protein
MTPLTLSLAISIDPASATAHGELAGLLLHGGEGRRPEIRSLLDRATALDPGDALIMSQMAMFQQVCAACGGMCRNV